MKTTAPTSQKTNAKKLALLPNIPLLDPKADNNPTEQMLSKADKDNIFNREMVIHLTALYNFAFHLTHDEEKANDLVQETCLRAYKSMDSYHKGTNGKAWLFKILKNYFINEYRKQQKQPIKINSEDIERYHDNEEQHKGKYLNLSHEVFQSMLGDEVSIALNSLSVNFKTIVLLCDIEGFTYEEIAKIVDIPIGTVRSRLHRARGVLKEKLFEYASKMGYANDTDLEANEPTI